MSRRPMTYRVVPLDSDEANQTPVGANGAESADMVAALSLAAWIGSGRKLPSYSRSHMPIRMTTLAEQNAFDDT